MPDQGHGGDGELACLAVSSDDMQTGVRGVTFFEGDHQRDLLRRNELSGFVAGLEEGGKPPGGHVARLLEAIPEDAPGGFVEVEDPTLGVDHEGGHREMFHAIVPTLFDALAAGKKPPVMSAEPGYIRVESGISPALEYATADSMHSFAVGAWVRVSGDGVLFAATGKSIDAQEVTLERPRSPLRTIELEEASSLEIVG